MILMMDVVSIISLKKKSREIEKMSLNSVLQSKNLYEDQIKIIG